MEVECEHKDYVEEVDKDTVTIICKQCGWKCVITYIDKEE